jgi:hypothetical protein
MLKKISDFFTLSARVRELEDKLQGLQDWTRFMVESFPATPLPGEHYDPLPAPPDLASAKASATYPIQAQWISREEFSNIAGRKMTNDVVMTANPDGSGSIENAKEPQ